MHYVNVIADIDIAVANDDWEVVQRIAHKLKGGAGGLGLVELQHVAAALEASLALPVKAADDSAPHIAALGAAWLRAVMVVVDLQGAPVAAEQDAGN